MEIKLLPLLVILTFGLFASIFADDNIALHRPYAFEPDPNYDPGSAAKPLLNSDPKRTRLTDGEFAPKVSIWGYEETVGWQDSNPIITIDLGTAQSISGVAFHTVGCGTAGVLWPKSIQIFVSDDGLSWDSAGDLVELSNNVNPPPEIREDSQSIIHQFETHELNLKGRYVQFKITCTPPFTFSDEIEIFGKPSSLSPSQENK